MNEIEKVLIDMADDTMAKLQSDIEVQNFYIEHVVKEDWPKDTGTSTIMSTRLPITEHNIPGVHIVERTIRLQHVAINSPDICLDGLLYTSDITPIFRLLRESLRMVWARRFREDIIKTITDRRVMRNESIKFVTIDGAKVAHESFPRRVNFFGKEVPALISASAVVGTKTVINPKYKKAAEQIVIFHPDIVHFLFPDASKWAGEMSWHNILDAEFNSDGHIGHYRLVLTYAAKPMQPDLGSVITVVPPGLKGWLWYWAWKLVRFVP